MNRGDYTLVAKGTTGHRLESMMQGETFAGVLNSPWDAKAAAAGMIRIADHRQVLPDYPGGVFAVGRSWAADHREILARFLRAWKDALDWLHKEENRAEALKLVAAEEKLDEKGAERKLAQSPRDGRLNLAGLQTVLELRVQFALTPMMGKDLKNYVDESFYQQAVGR
jgi:ABC-type nitrate/sulfonate/bicarbonate transport system substrate-binding protein